jgi:hypothetical protein
MERQLREYIGGYHVQYLLRPGVPEKTLPNPNVLALHSKTTLLLLLLQSLFAFAGNVKENVPSSFDLYVCIGQSNMAGRATLTPEVMDTLQNVYLLNDKGNFEPAVNPLNRYSTVRKDLSMQRLGPAYGFAKEMARQTKRPVGLVVNARGGSSINSWLKGSKDGYYEEALSRVRIAMKQGGVLKAILWHQGEADCSNPEAYKQKLISLVKDLREDLGMPNLPVIVGQISQWNWTKREAGTVPFNQMIKKVSSFIPYSDWVSSKGLGWYKDEKDPHFNTEAQLLLGKRYAKKILKFYKHQ